MMGLENSARYTYRDHLVQKMALNARIVCLDTDTGLFTGVDLGSSGSRYINLGIAEQNAMGIAAGIAAAGWIPFVNTMATFATTRATEAVKVDVCYNNLPVRIIGTHGGLASGHFGPTHHALEDLALMRVLPNMTVVVPGDVRTLPSLLDQVTELPGPAYVRLDRHASPMLPVPPMDVELGRIQSYVEGSDVVVVCTGPFPLLRSLEAAEHLSNDHLSVAVLYAHTLKPFDVDTLLERARGSSVVVTVEEHWRSGGLGSIVAETLAEEAPRPVIRIGISDTFVDEPGSQEELLDRVGISTLGIVETVHRAVRRFAAAPIRHLEAIP